MPPKKTKFVNIEDKDCASVILPGRHRCECQAIKHPLINNCLSCGRVVCAQEGKGPCFCCGDLVLTRSERYRVLEGNSRKTQDLVAKYSKLPRPQDDLKEQSAVSQKERLLEYDRTSAQRTKVIDDQADYFATDSPWLSEEEKKLQKLKEEAYKDMKSRLRRKTKVTIDFAGRRIIEEAPEMPNLEDFNMMGKSSTQMISRNASRMHSDPNGGELTTSELYDNPEFVGELEKKRKDLTNDVPILWSRRIQDPELQEMVDAGNCLSLHQPYATLVVDGIKMFEGRNWYTPVRGRLWICAGNKEPTPEQIEKVKISYKHIVGDIDFPKNYTTGCLLGCVDLIDCLPQEEYIQIYPNGEIADPYVWVLANPKNLPFRLPVQPKQKIFQLEQHILQAAKRALK